MVEENEEEKKPEHVEKSLTEQALKSEESLLDCIDCDMAFENKQVLGQHIEEIHL